MAQWLKVHTGYTEDLNLVPGLTSDGSQIPIILAPGDPIAIYFSFFERKESGILVKVFEVLMFLFLFVSEVAIKSFKIS